jgi:hypothetical protein
MRKARKKYINDPAKSRLTFGVLRLLAGKTPREAVEGTTTSDPNGRSISPSTVRALRRPIKDGGTKYPRSSTLERLCEAHGCELSITKNGKILFQG